MKNNKEPLKVFFTLVALLFLYGCGKNASEKAVRTTHFAQAKHFDIPTPLGFKQTYSKTDALDHKLVDEIHFEGAVKENPSVHFIQNLEAFGWSLEILNGSATSIVASKPSKKLHMLIWLDNKTWQVHIFVSTDT